MRRLALFAFVTVAFCPPIGMLLMLAYAALTGGLGLVFLRSRLDADRPLGWGQPALPRRLPRQPLSGVPNARTGMARDGCCFAPMRRAGGSALPDRVLSALTRIEVQEGVCGCSARHSVRGLGVMEPSCIRAFRRAEPPFDQSCHKAPERPPRANASVRRVPASTPWQPDPITHSREMLPSRISASFATAPVCSWSKGAADPQGEEQERNHGPDRLRSSRGRPAG